MDFIRLTDMGKITKISVQEKNKNRVNIFVDEDFKMGLSMEVAIKYRLKVGDEFDEKDFLSILIEDEKNRAITLANSYISRALKTKRQVKDHLLKKGISEDIVWQTIDKLKEYGYIDDKDYALKYIESTKAKQGKRLASFKLMSKGVKKEDIENAYLEREDDNDEECAINLAKKYMKNKDITKENVCKTYRYLIGRGFSYEQAEKAVSVFKLDYQDS